MTREQLIEAVQSVALCTEAWHSDVMSHCLGMGYSAEEIRNAIEAAQFNEELTIIRHRSGRLIVSLNAATANVILV